MLLGLSFSLQHMTQCSLHCLSGFISTCNTNPTLYKHIIFTCTQYFFHSKKKTTIFCIAFALYTYCILETLSSNDTVTDVVCLVSLLLLIACSIRAMYMWTTNHSSGFAWNTMYSNVMYSNVMYSYVELCYVQKYKQCSRCQWTEFDQIVSSLSIALSLSCQYIFNYFHLNWPKSWRLRNLYRTQMNLVFIWLK